MARIELESTGNYKVVVLLGSAGTGKSTIVNMLFNEDVSAESCKKPQMTAATAKAVTTEPLWLLKVKDTCETWTVYGDTVGFGDSTKSEEDIGRGIRKFLMMLKGGVHCLIFVIKYGRLSKWDRANLVTLRTLFGNRWKSSAILLLTHYTHEFTSDGWKEKALQRWSEGDTEATELLKEFGDRVVVTNNNCDGPYDSLTLPLRQIALNELVGFISTSTKLISVRKNFASNWDILLEKHIRQQLNKDYGIATQFILAHIFGQTVKTGDCPLCLEMMELEDTGHNDPCHHVFHVECIRQAVRAAGDLCPVCRTPVVHINRTLLAIGGEDAEASENSSDLESSDMPSAPEATSAPIVVENKKKCRIL